MRFLLGCVEGAVLTWLAFWLGERTGRRRARREYERADLVAERRLRTTMRESLERLISRRFN